MKKTKDNFRLIMISAMYENGGNTIHRFFDGHPELFVYPFESQLGTPLVADYFASLFPVKYRWPEFSLEGSYGQDYELIIDEELKRHIKTPFASKFKEAHMKLEDKERKRIFLQILKKKGRTRRNIIESFFVSTFNTWENYNRSGKEIAYVGYSPVVCVDSEKIFKDFPSAHIIHIVRNPYSAYADTKKRPVPYSIYRYAQTWNIVQLVALSFQTMYPKNFHLVRFEDLTANPKDFFEALTREIGISYSKTLEYPSWNGRKLDAIVPWGTIKKATSKANTKTLKELSKDEYNKIKKQTSVTNKLLGYDGL